VDKPLNHKGHFKIDLLDASDGRMMDVFVYPIIAEE